MGEISFLPLQLYRDENASWLGLCSCNKRPMSCPVWGKVLTNLSEKDLFSAEDPFSLPVSDVGLEEEIHSNHRAIAHKLQRLLRWSSHIVPMMSHFHFKTYRQWVENRDLVVKEFARAQNVAHVVDSSKDLLQLMDLHKYSKIPTKTIFLTRDVRGVAYSAQKNGFSTPKAEISNWTRTNGRILEYLKSTDRQNWIHIRYEDICIDTESELRKIEDFLGIEPAQLKPDIELNRRHTIAGNKIRFNPLDHIREDQAWIDKLSASDLKIINNVAAEMAQTLGYRL